VIEVAEEGDGLQAAPDSSLTADDGDVLALEVPLRVLEAESVDRLVRLALVLCTDEAELVLIICDRELELDTHAVTGQRDTNSRWHFDLALDPGTVPAAAVASTLLTVKLDD
jgi:hypothetical protein